jgi:hypothetical protein
MLASNAQTAYRCERDSLLSKAYSTQRSPWASMIRAVFLGDGSKRSIWKANSCMAKQVYHLDSGFPGSKHSFWLPIVLIFPMELCSIVLNGLCRQISRSMHTGSLGLHPIDKRSSIPDLFKIDKHFRRWLSLLKCQILTISCNIGDQYGSFCDVI